MQRDVCRSCSSSTAESSGAAGDACEGAAGEEAAGGAASGGAAAAAASGAGAAAAAGSGVVAHLTYKTKHACVGALRKLQQNTDDVIAAPAGPRKANAVLWVGNCRGLSLFFV